MPQQNAHPPVRIQVPTSPAGDTSRPSAKEQDPTMSPKSRLPHEEERMQDAVLVLPPNYPPYEDRIKMRLPVHFTHVNQVEETRTCDDYAISRVVRAEAQVFRTITTSDDHRPKPQPYFTVSGLLPRDHFQRRNARSGPITPNEPEYRSYRTRSPGPSHHVETRSRSPRCPSRHPSTHSYDFNPPSLSSSRHPSYDMSRCPSRRPSVQLDHHSHLSDASSSHNHRGSDGYYYGDSEWSTNHGNHSPEWPGAPSTTSSLHSQRQREAPHDYGDDKLPFYSSASQYARSPVLAPSYRDSRYTPRPHLAPPPSYRSTSSRSSRDHGGPRQLPATRRPSHFFPSELPSRDYFIDKHGERRL